MTLPLRHAAFACLALAAFVPGQGRKDYRLPIHWNRLYNYSEVTNLVDRIQQTWPNFVRKVELLPASSWLAAGHR